MVVKILIALAVSVVVLVVVIATRPSEFRVQRTATMSAPAPVVFGHVNDFHKWEAWSPYAKREGSGLTSLFAAAGRGPEDTRDCWGGPVAGALGSSSETSKTCLPPLSSSM